METQLIRTGARSALIAVMTGLASVTSLRPGDTPLLDIEPKN